MSKQIRDWFLKYKLEEGNINERFKRHQSVTHFGKYPIHVACLERNKYLLKELLIREPYLNAYSVPDGRNILHYCCLANLELVKIIYNSNIRSLLFIQDKYEMTPLDIALHYNKIDIIVYFIENGLFTDNSLLIKYLFRLEDINHSLLTPIQRNKFRLLRNIVFHKCLNYLNEYYNFKTQIGILFKKNNLYLSYLSGIEELKSNIYDYVGFNSRKCHNILDFVNLLSLLILNG